MAIRRNTNRVNDQELDALLARFEEGTSIDEKHTLHFLHADSNELEQILPDAFDADPGFSHRQLRSVLRAALWACRKAGTMTSAALAAEAKKLAKQQLAQPPQTFAVWTKFRASQMAFAKSFRLEWDGVTLQSAAQLPAYMAKGEFFLNGHGTILPNQPAFYGHLIARCSARTEENAVIKMLDAEKLFMAIFNMYDLYAQWSFIGGRWSEGKLWPGPYHFVFRGKTFLSNEHVWYNPDFREDVWTTHTLSMNKVLTLIPRVRKVMAALQTHPLRSVLVDMLMLMQDGMASGDTSYRLLRYWSALEQLYGEPAARVKNYPKIIQRATFADPDKLLARWKLTHISKLRNDYVHAGDNDDDLQVMCQHLRLLLSRHINYLIFQGGHLVSHAEWIEIVDLPDDESRLLERRQVLDKRLDLLRRERNSRDPA